MGGPGSHGTRCGACPPKERAKVEGEGRGAAQRAEGALGPALQPLPCPAAQASTDPHTLGALLPFPRLEFFHLPAPLPTAVVPTHGPSGAACLLPGWAGQALLSTD